MITKQDILDKQFSTTFRGYNKEEVDEFLDEIMATLDALGQSSEKPSFDNPTETFSSAIEEDSPY